MMYQINSNYYLSKSRELSQNEWKSALAVPSTQKMHQHLTSTESWWEKPTALQEKSYTVRYVDAQQPTKRTRHVEMKQFAILHWSEEEKIKYEDVPTAYNPSDSLSKQTGRYKFYEHRDIIKSQLDNIPQLGDEKFAVEGPSL